VSDNIIGAVLTVGGGIGGVQASLDLAESGYRVYLVEEKPCIGGVMAQLDKTFPTNDCSACIFSPKLQTLAQNPNIEIITNSELLSVEGEPGDFRVKLIEHPRYVDMDKCNACGDCFEACPVEVPNDFDARLASRKAIYKLYPQGVPNKAAIDKAGVSPCKDACPAHIHVQGYLALARRGKYKEALDLIRKDCPLPSVCGRVCVRFCEEKCTRVRVDESVAINDVKWFLSEQTSEEDIPQIAEPKNRKVAVIGAGPGGLTCAYYLALAGYSVTIFEKEPEAGGVLRYGIPAYRLPREVLRRDVEYIERCGVEICCSKALGPDFTVESLREEGFEAIFLGVGCSTGSKLQVPGEDAQGVIQGIDLLNAAAKEEPVQTGKKAVVIGGGNVAIDASRTLVRLGVDDVLILYRRSREEMPAYDEEIEAAIEEGVQIRFLTAPVEVLTDEGRVKGIRCVRMELGEPDSSGRRRPVPVEGSEFDVETDLVVPAIGQVVSADLLDSLADVDRGRGGRVEVDPLTFETSVAGLFAAGDLVTGPRTVIEAIAGGKEAAESIKRFLEGEDLRAGRGGERAVANPDISDVVAVPRRRKDEVPPDERKHTFEEVHRGFDEDAVKAETGRCLDCGVCSECMECVRVCQAGAIRHEDVEREIELNVGSIILTPGYELFDTSKIAEYGHGIAPNVVTNLEMERILSASGPFEGEVRRPSDGTHPRRIAWIQCVGSRDRRKGMPHCSSVCCMASIKEAIIAREHDANIEPTIFYMDIRAYGKDFDKYYERAKSDSGVRFIRSMVSRVVDDPLTHDLQITYLDENDRLITETFDMVVLAVGIKTSDATRRLAKTIGVDLDENNFCNTGTFAPVQTSRPGVLVAGVFQSPKDIPQTVMEASAAAGVATGLLAKARETLTTKKELPPEKDLSGKEPRIGVFVCRCGINIASTVDVPSVVDEVKQLPGVAYATENLFTCTQDAQAQIKNAIEENDLNRLIVASCTPRTHLPLFQETAREAGLNKYLVEMANIREHCSWVHMKEKEKATDKALDLIRMAVARTSRLEQIQDQQLPMIQSALVIGGGVAGMTAAENLAAQGFPVDLLERTDTLGGNALKLSHTLKGEEIRPFVADLVERVTNNDRITVHLNAEIQNVQGFIGKFKTTISLNGTGEKEIEHGVAVVATGASEWKPDVYGYGTDPRIRTHLDMSQAMDAKDPAVINAGTTVFIQCVGSRCEERPWCSKVCCNHTVMDAIALKQGNPDAKIFVLYRDVRTFGLNEPYYEEARRLGVVFARYEPENPPTVDVGEKIVVRVRDLALGGTLTLEADNLVLAAAIIPHEDNAALAKLFKLSTNEDGFFLEAHMKLRPVDFATEGVFLAGLAHYPKPLDETIAQAEAAGAHAAQIVARGYVEAPGMVSSVDQFLCRACGRCVEVCPFGAPELKEIRPGVTASEINPALCKGCGACGVACPTGAAAIRHFKDDQVGEMIDAALA
jgi:heterodisulfide reductase subunit A-like polyferredoxin